MFPAFQERLRTLFRRAKFDGGVVSKSTPVVEVAQTWNKKSDALYAGITKIKKVANFDQNNVDVFHEWNLNGARVAAVTEQGISCYRIGRPYFDQWRTAVYIGGSNDVCHLAISQSGGFLWGPYANADGATDMGIFRASSNGIKVTDSGTTNLRDITLRNILGTGSLATGIAAKTANYTSTTNDGTLTFDATGGAITNTLETAVGAAGRIKVIVKIDASANAVTVDPNAAETINGAATLALAAQWDRAIIQSDGANWVRIA